MKLSNIGEVNDFLEVVNRCEGDVWLQSVEGDKINLKSSLSQYVAIAELIKDEGNNLELFVPSQVMKLSSSYCLVSTRTFHKSGVNYTK